MHHLTTVTLGGIAVEGRQSGYVLVIDDQRGLRLLLAEVLRGMGIPARIAANGQEGIRLAHGEVPFLALVDMKMPGMDGLDTILALRAAGIQCPFRLMTALDGRDPRIRDTLALSGVELLAKPFDINVVRHLLHEMNRNEGAPSVGKACPFS